MQALTITVLVLLAAQSAPAALGPHPRLQIDQQLVQKIRTLRDANDPAWVRLNKWTRAARANAQPGSFVLSNMMLHVVSADDTAFERAWKFVGARIYQNKGTGLGGSCPCLICIPGTITSGVHRRGFYGVVAHFYDWGYSTLSAEQKEDLVKWLVDASRFTALETRVPGRFFAMTGRRRPSGLPRRRSRWLAKRPRRKT